MLDAPRLRTDDELTPPDDDREQEMRKRELREQEWCDLELTRRNEK